MLISLENLSAGKFIFSSIVECDMKTENDRYQDVLCVKGKTNRMYRDTLYHSSWNGEIFFFKTHSPTWLANLWRPIEADLESNQKRNVDLKFIKNIDIKKGYNFIIASAKSNIPKGDLLIGPSPDDEVSYPTPNRIGIK